MWEGFVAIITTQSFQGCAPVHTYKFIKRRKQLHIKLSNGVTWKSDIKYIDDV